MINQSTALVQATDELLIKTLVDGTVRGMETGKGCKEAASNAFCALFPHLKSLELHVEFLSCKEIIIPLALEEMRKRRRAHTAKPTSWQRHPPRLQPKPKFRWRLQPSPEIFQKEMAKRFDPSGL